MWNSRTCAYRHRATTWPRLSRRMIRPGSSCSIFATSLSRHETATGLVWASDERLVFTSTTQEGPLAAPRLTGDFYAINADGSRMRQIFGRTDRATFRVAQIIHLLPDDPNHVLISMRTNHDEVPTAYRMNIYRAYQSGTQRRSRRLPLETVTRSPLERGQLAADRDGAVRFAYGTDDDGNQQFAWRAEADGEWIRFDNPFGADIGFWGFDHDGEHVYFASRDQDNLGVFRIHLESGQFKSLLTDDTFEATSPIYDRSTDTLIGAIFATPTPEARFFDPDQTTARLWRSLQASMPTYFVRISNFTEDGKRAIVEISSDREPGTFLLFDAENMQAGQIAARKNWIDPSALAEKQPVSFTARDGLELHGYLTVPPDADDGPLPLVVEVHGGPHGPRDGWFYEPWVQAMATRGFAVLQINFRGSGGRGYQFEHDAYGMWGAEMQDDITDGTRWAIEQGIADPDRICISGASYGGFSTLSGLVREPDLYRCGFAFVGVYDMELMKDEGNIPSTEPGRRYLDRALGTDIDVMRERSPIHHVENIRADLFVAHGAEDRQAHVGQYHALISRLEDAGIRHEAMLVPREGHGFYEVDNRVDLYSRALEFFDRNIGAGWRPERSASPAETE
jgi:dipeptidyl aminopeptidase/acylaminoacyl peptidase